MSDLQNRTVKELKAMAEELDVTYGDAKKRAGGKTPNKGHWVEAIEAKTNGTWEIPESKTAADLTRKGLLAGIPDDEIRAAVKAEYPDYGALKICVPVYRRELRKKGLLPDDG